MGEPRADGLPRPYSAEAEYLAAILDAIRGLSQALSPPVAEEKPKDEVELVETPPKTVAEDKVKETVAPSPLPEPDPDIDSHEKPPAPAKPRKPRAKRQTKPRQTRKAKS